MRWEATVLLLLLGCSGSTSDDPVTQYPPTSTPGDPTSPTTQDPNDPSKPKDPDPPPTPLKAQQILNRGVNIESITSENDLVLTDATDLLVLPHGATTPTVVVKDYDFDNDSFTVRGRMIGVWLGEDQKASPLTSWTAASGVKTAGVTTSRMALYPKAGTDTFAYLSTATNILQSNVFVTTAGQTTGTQIITSLDSGLATKPCKPTILWAGSDLLVGGCVNGSTTPKVALYSTSGGATKTILDSSAPGLWIDHARTHAIVQTTTAAEIRSLGATATVALDTPIKQAAFSSDDSKVIYVRADGKLRRASTTAPATPIDLGTSAGIMMYSPDARWIAHATKVDSNGRGDIILVDANNPASPKTVAQDGAIFYGLSSDASALVYVQTSDLGAEGPLVVVPTSGGAPTTVATEAQRVVFDGKTVYWQEYDKAAKSNVLKAVKLSALSNVLTLDQGLDALTAFGVMAGDRLYVASKTGLWMYPAVP